MRRKKQEIKDVKILNEIICKAQVCRLGLSSENTPYIVPMSFGFKDNILYFHSASEGKKIEILKENQNVCFEFERNISLLRENKPCDWGMKYQSIIGYGNAVFIENLEEKREALNIIMNQYSDKLFTFQDAAISKTIVFKVPITSMTGKQDK